jgi:hypothetical protein
LISIFGVPLEERLDFQLVHSATQTASEPSLKPKVKIAESSSEELQEFGASLHQKVTDDMSQHPFTPRSKRPCFAAEYYLARDPTIFVRVTWQ